MCPESKKYHIKFLTQWNRFDSNPVHPVLETGYVRSALLMFDYNVEIFIAFSLSHFLGYFPYRIGFKIVRNGFKMVPYLIHLPFFMQIHTAFATVLYNISAK